MKLLAAFISVVVSLFALSGSVLAHGYKSSGPITVLYHAEPDDDVVAKQPATLIFFITDKSHLFNLSDCDCRVAVRELGHQAVIVPLTTAKARGTSGDEARAPYTFPGGGTYDVELRGTSKRLNGFAPFRVSYKEDIAAAPRGTRLFNGISQGWIVFILSLGVLGLMALLVWGQQLPKNDLTPPEDSERFANPLLHYGFYVLLLGIAILTLFGNTVYTHYAH